MRKTLRKFGSRGSYIYFTPEERKNYGLHIGKTYEFEPMEIKIKSEGKK